MSAISSDYIKNLTVGAFCHLNTISVDDLLMLVQRGSVGSEYPIYEENGGQMSLSPAKVEEDPNAVNIRSVAGRDAYDDAIRQAMLGIEGGWVKSADLRKIVGGKSGQLRQRLTALMSEELGEVEQRGQAAGVEYKLTRKGRNKAGKLEAAD